MSTKVMNVKTTTTGATADDTTPKMKGKEVPSAAAAVKKARNGLKASMTGAFVELDSPHLKDVVDETRREQHDAKWYPGITREAIAVAGRYGVPIDAKSWKAQRDTGTISFKWYVPCTTRDHKGKFVSPFPHGHFSITRWTNPVDGKPQRRHGREEFYTATGRLYHTIEWKWGQRVGKEAWFDVETREVKRVRTWVAGTLKKWGLKGARRESRLSGIEQRFEGPVHRTITWKNGMRHGPERAVHTVTGTVLFECTWVVIKERGQSHSVYDGKVITRIRNGTVVKCLNFVLGRKNGDQVRYTHKGIEHHVVPFYHGLRHGDEVWADGSTYHWCMGEQREERGPANAFEACY